MHKTLKVSILNVDFQDSIPWFSVFLLPTVSIWSHIWTPPNVTPSPRPRKEGRCRKWLSVTLASFSHPPFFLLGAVAITSSFSYLLFFIPLALHHPSRGGANITLGYFSLLGVTLSCRHPLNLQVSPCPLR
jgi:hypothetical protein